MNGTPASTGGKRKADGSLQASPPAKRPVNGSSKPSIDTDMTTPDITIDDVSYDDRSDAESDIHPVAMYVGTPGSLGEWQDTIQKVVRNVVAIRFCQTCSFDTDGALTSEATGFVVDSERGYVRRMLCTCLVFARLGWQRMSASRRFNVPLLTCYCF
jgi:pro-apoptotic serine protease NMA111